MVENVPPDQAPRLTVGRWCLAEFVQFSYTEPAIFTVEVGPLDRDPTDAQLDQLFDYLSKRRFPWLELGELEWILDLDVLAKANLSGLPVDGLHGRLTHEPAFQIGSLETTAGLKVYLRIRFEKEDAPPAEPSFPVDKDSNAADEATTDGPRDPSLIYFQSAFSPEVCKQKLGVFARSDPGSFLNAYSSPAREFTVTLREDGSIEIERSAPGPDPYQIVFCGVLQAEDDGTEVVGRFTIVDRDLFVSMKPYLFFLEAFISGLLGMRWANDDAASASLKTQGGVCIVAALGLLSMAYRAFQSAKQARVDLLNKETPALTQFIQKNLEAKPEA